ncbi:MAG: ABC-2 family transporter protein [Candidatus Sungbacteria bacterium]|nr:ABC-2 family transporter protein [Candidatus Sungbacteria bacterium]
MKYLRTFLLALQVEFSSRINIFGWFLCSLIPSLLLILVWFAILGERESISGFTKGDFAVYYLFITMGWYIVGGTFGISTGRKIKNGMINTTLLKPYNVVLGQCLEEQAWKAISFFLALPIMVFIVFLLRDNISIHLSFGHILLLIVSLILGGINFALIQGLVGISAFWITEVWPVDHLRVILLSLFGGLLVPLALMPSAVRALSDFLPFKYMFYVPVSILLSKNSNPYLDAGIQLLYIGILFGIYTLVWSRGIKKYEAIGI